MMCRILININIQPRVLCEKIQPIVSINNMGALRDEKEPGYKF